MKFKYSLLTFSFIQCCNKDVFTLVGANVSEFIRAIRSFISLDLIAVQILFFVPEYVKNMHKHAQ